MAWKQKCVAALNQEKMFENSAHQTRFIELVDCFSKYPFFTKGLCKCIFLSAMDEEHFCIMLETLTDLSLGKDTNTKEMSVKGDALAEESNADDACIYQLSLALLDDIPFDYDPDAPLSEMTHYLIRRALKASEILNRLD